MAIFSLHIEPVKRSAGRSATACAAYRAADLIYDETTGQTFDYRRKRGVEHAEIVLPAEAAKQDINWARDRQTLWNEAERAERRSNSRPAREYLFALPHELSPEQRVELTRSYAQYIADRYHCAVDFAVHQPDRHGDERNHHAHLLATTRVIEPGGLGAKAEPEWSLDNRLKAGLLPGPEEFVVIRDALATMINGRLQELEIDARVDHRTLKEQGIEREPTTHLGPAVSGLERRGVETEVGKRLAAEREQAAARRHEGLELSRSIVEVSKEIGTAERGLERGSPPASLEEIRRQAREHWLALRAEELAQSPPLTPEEERARARERWLEYRHAQGAEKATGIEPEKNREKDLGKEKDGLESEFDP